MATEININKKEQSKYKGTYYTVRDELNKEICHIAKDDLKAIHVIRRIINKGDKIEASTDSCGNIQVYALKRKKQIF